MNESPPTDPYWTKAFLAFCCLCYNRATCIDARKSHISRDAQNLHRFVQWFLSHPPFPDFDDIMSISTGIIGDEMTNPHFAYDVGVSSMSNIAGNYFVKVKFQRKKRVKPLCVIMTGLIHKEFSYLPDPEMLFRRISYAKKSQEQFKENFQHKLPSHSLPLFDEFGMLKNQ